MENVTEWREGKWTLSESGNLVELHKADEPEDERDDGGETGIPWTLRNELE